MLDGWLREIQRLTLNCWQLEATKKLFGELFSANFLSTKMTAIVGNCKQANFGSVEWPEWPFAGRPFDEGEKDGEEEGDDTDEHICDTKTLNPTTPKIENQSSSREVNREHYLLLNSSTQTNFYKLNSLIRIYCFISACSILVPGECLVINVASTGGGAARPTRDTTTTRRVHFKRSTGELSSAKLQEIDALAYLHRYGYMNGSLSSSDNLITEDSFHEAVMSFQRFAGIPETGSVDPTTLKFMQMPRCGNKDRSSKGENGRRRRKRRRRRRRKRYALQGSKWRRQELTYRISQYPTRFLSKRHEVDGQIEKAFKIWSQVAPIDFVVKKEGRVHIDIRFASGEHGDGDPFDGPGNTLAHAYFPQYGGDAHFDDQEYWTVDSYTGTNIFQVAAHELGHSLGLGHSSVREALMAPFYQKYKPNFKLHADDILGIQALYGEKSAAADDDEDPDSGDRPSSTSTSTSTTSTTTTTTTSTETPRRRTFFGSAGSEDDESTPRAQPKAVDLCQDAAIDAITRTEDGNTYVFRGQHYWQVKNEGLANGGAPSRISRDWDGLPGDLDAALTWSDGKTFFFKGDRYWRFQNKRREPGYPKLISAGFAGIPNNLDAAFVWGGNGKTYFFKRDKYWRYDSKQEPPVSGLYPKSIKNWSGLPAGGVQAAFQWENGMSYFFKDDLYYRFDDREFEVDKTAKPAFPRSTAEWWFGCTNSNLPLRSSSSSSPSAGGDLDSQSSLLFHRKPNLLYSSSGSSESAASTSSAQQRGQENSRSAGGGSSAISNFLSSLGSLWGSSSASASASGSSSGRSNSDQSSSDWSFHRGIGEEVHKQLLKSGGSDSTRWNFPISSSSSSGSNRGEQSRSELRMERPSN